jgi:carotenoid cleavage dioxygenase
MVRLKDTASTDCVVHAGRILPSWYLCGEAYAVNLDTLETEGIHEWSPKDGVSAHAKVDESTGELLFFNYQRAGMHYGVVNKNNKLVHYVPIPLPRPQNSPHDMCFTKNYSILNDFNRNRFGIIPRYGDSSQLKWFDAKPTYVLHWLNAYEVRICHS